MNKVITALLLAAAPAAPALAQHTLGEPNPFHLSPGDAFVVPVTGGTFAGAAGVEVRLTPVGGGAPTTLAPESVVANTSVSARLPAGLAVGQYDVKVVISGTESNPPDPRLWVRLRPFRFVGKSRTYLPGMPCASGSFPGCTNTNPDYKDADFGDVNNDGFLDVFSANSESGQDIDRLHINQRGRDPSARDCPTDYCDQTSTQFENTVPGVPTENRTYDADLVDLDRDGDLDLVRVDNGGALFRLFLNDGSGHFVDRTITRSGIGPALLPPLSDIQTAKGGGSIATVDPGDVDGDGRTDLILCNWGGTGARTVLLLNRLATTGRFVIANTPCSGSGGDAFCQAEAPTNRGCGFGRFNADDRLDIILAGLDAAADDVVLINTGNDGAGVPQFTVESNWIRGPAPGFGAPLDAPAGNLSVADLDGDGDDDVAVGSPWNTEPRGRILWNDNRTRLVELDPSRYVLADGAYNTTFADVDRDGDLDVMFCPYPARGQAVMINRGGRDANMKFEPRSPSDLWFAESPGGGTVAAPPAYLDFQLSMSGGDYDLDGDIDVVTGGFSSVRVWRSDLFDQPGEDRDWVFVLDRTRSMITGRDFFEPAKNVLKTFLAQRRPDDKVGLVAFDYTGPHTGNPNAPDDANKAQVLAQVGEKTAAELLSEVDGLGIGSCSGFCTAVGWALKTGKEVAQGAPDPNREKVLVLITDGATNQGPHPDTIIPTLPSNIRLYTVALGSDTDDRMLSALATNGGKFYYAGRSADYASVQSSLRDIDEDVESHATGKQVLPLVRELIWAPLFKETLERSPLLRPHLGAVPPPVEQPIVLRDLIVVDPADRQVRFTLNWRRPSRQNGMILTDPKGRVYPLPGDDRVRERKGDRFHVIEVADPLSGVWTVQRLVLGDSGPGKLTASASSALRLAAQPRHPLFYVGEPLHVRVELHDAGTAIPGFQVQARVVTPSKQEQVVGASRVDDKTFEVTVPNANEAGTYRLEVVALGPPGRPFVRTWTSAVHVAAPTPTEPDLRKAELTLDRRVLPVGGTATATLRLLRRDGTPLDGAAVSFAAEGASPVGAVQALGGGRYRQPLKAGEFAGAGAVTARAELARLPNREEFRVEAGAVDPGKSTLVLVVGVQKLCTDQRGRFPLRVVPADAFENPLPGAHVEIEKIAGPYLQWDGPVREIEGGGLYERRFWGPSTPGTFQFQARVNGVIVAQTVSMDVFAAGSPEAQAIGCVPIAGSPPFDFGRWPWLWLLLLLLVLLLILYFFWRRSPAPATP